MKTMQEKNLNSRILIIDDDEKLLKLLSEYLPRYQIEVITSETPEKGLLELFRRTPDLVVLDVLMPGMDGFEVCRTIRQKSRVPILMLSARGESTDKIIGLELGADDYMSKPFDPRELVSRIQSILRRSGKSYDQGKICFGSFEIRPAEREVYSSGSPVDLTSMEYELLLFFAQNPGKKLSRDEIMRRLQGNDSASYSRSIDILVSRLRSKLGETAKNPHLIKSIHGFGYVFSGEAG
jgi:DNA-binding response OmpR family regulator